jgi:8-oxo-dGTP pyrophosphatase MutT (NUDIX family)
VARRRSYSRNGSVEPLEDPDGAIRREVEEELGVIPVVGRIVGAYGGPDLASTYPNGDQVSYVTVAYECQIPYESLDLERQELIEVVWHDLTTIETLPRHTWIDRVLNDVVAR